MTVAMLRYMLTACAILGVLALVTLGTGAALDSYLGPRARTSSSPSPGSRAPAETPTAAPALQQASASAAAVPAPPLEPELPSAGLIREVARLQERARHAPRELDPNFFQMPVLLPLSARAALRAYKDAVLAALEALMQEAADPDELDDATLERVFVAGGVAWIHQGPSDHRLYASVRSAPGHVSRWVVSFGFTVECGTDNVLAVFERPRMGWGPARLAMVARDDDFTSVAGFRFALDWAISPPDFRDRYNLVIAYTFPWCGSNWRTFKYAVIEPTGDPRSPNVLVNEEEPHHLWRDGVALDSRADGFSVTFNDWPLRGDGVQTWMRREWARRRRKFLRMPSTLAPAWSAR